MGADAKLEMKHSSEAIHDDGGDVRHDKLENHSAHGEEEEAGEPWLLSYADMVTLLMCFFVLFFSVEKTKGAISDPQRLKQKLESLIALDEGILAKDRGGKDPKSPDIRTQATVEGIRSKLTSLSKVFKVTFTLNEPEPGTFEIVLLNAGLFSPGQGSLTPTGEAVVDGFAPKLASLDARSEVEVEGHTDSDPVRASEYPSNWELSAARASAVARRIIGNGFSPQRIRVAGFGEFRPLAREIDDTGIVVPSAKKMNRRVTIRVKLPESHP